MALAYIQPAFSVGELSPSLYGRTDLQAFHRGAATMRNCFVDYRGGASSRAGTAFVCLSKQGNSAIPPQLIPFRFALGTNFLLEFGDHYMRVISNGAPVTEAAILITAATQTNPATITVPGHNFLVGDSIFVSGVLGMTRLNGRTFKILGIAGSVLSLGDLFGNPVNSGAYTAYTSGGSAARIYTITTPYAAADVAGIKYTQSAAVMTLAHPNYPVYELAASAPNSWALTAVTFTSAVRAPTLSTVAASNTTGTNPTCYSYVVTAVDVNGNESIASNIGTVTNSVNINSTLGTIKITWASVPGAVIYNIYKAPVTVNGTTPVGVLFGYAGSALGLQFVDTNITADFSITPPIHSNPFAVQAITSVSVTAGGSGYTAATAISVNSTTGSGAVILPVIVSNVLSGIIIQNGGQGYLPTDTISVSDSGGGTGATATFTLGPSSGTFPGCVGYFQQRRVFANSNNNPDTYWMSKPGTPSNFDSAAISIDTDSIEGTPWAQQVQGIQAMVPMPGGLVVFTGLGVWQVNGGQPGAAITPANQAAVPQAYNGSHFHLQPININFDIIYVQAKGAIVRDLAYNIFANIYTGTDISVLSNHFFENRQVVSWAWAEEPYKLIWCILDNGKMLSLTYLKEQEIQGWARHDTNGLFVACAVVGELPVDALYVVVQRVVNNQSWFFIERMDNRLWEQIEDCWCFDAGVKYAQPKPNATAMLSAADGPHSISAVAVLTGGSGYVSPTVEVFDPGGGTGAALTATVAGGIITAINVISGGQNYKAPRIRITDTAGVGASGQAALTAAVTLQTDAAVFDSSSLGAVFRGGGGRGTISQVLSSKSALVEVTVPFTMLYPDTYDEDGAIIDGPPTPIISGNWTLTQPTMQVYAEHLQGQIICVLADGNLIQNLTVASDGMISLPVAASNVVIGVPFIAQVQSMNVEMPGDQTIQGKRKNISAVTLRVKGSRGISIGVNQPNASQQENQAEIPWNVSLVKEQGNNPAAGAAIPLFSGDIRQTVTGMWGVDSKPGQVCAQQECGLPMSLLAFIPEVTVGDDNG